MRYVNILALALLLFSCSNPKQKEAPAEDFEMIVRTVVADMQLELPKDLGNGVKLTKMYLKDKDVVYEYELDENINNMADTKANEARMKDDIRASMQQVPADKKKELDYFFQSVYKTGRNLVYRYIGNKTHTEWRVVFSKEELEKM